MVHSNRDEKLARLRDEFGLEGYGLYWLILETIAEQMDETDKSFVEFSPKMWRKFTEISRKKLEKFLTFSEKIGLFSVKISSDLIKVDCPNLLKYRDEYTKRKKKKSGQTPDNVRTKSGQTPEQDTDTDTETEKEKDIYVNSKAVDASSASSPPPCPHQKIIDLYHQILPELPRVQKWTQTRQKLLQARWKEDKKQQTLQFWENYFRKVRSSDFLMGKVIGRNGRSFMPDLEWLIRPTNFVKVLEGRYDNTDNTINTQSGETPPQWTIQALTDFMGGIPPTLRDLKYYQSQGQLADPIPPNWEEKRKKILQKRGIKIK